MKKIILTLTICLIPSLAHAGIFSIVKDFNLFKNETENNIKNQRNDYSALKMENAEALAKIDARIGSIEANLKVNASALAGVNNRVDNVSVGRDQTQTTTTNNDSRLMGYIIKMLCGIAGTILLQMVALLKYQSGMYERLLKAKDLTISNLIERIAKKENETDSWQQKFIEMLVDKKPEGGVKA